MAHSRDNFQLKSAASRRGLFNLSVTGVQVVVLVAVAPLALFPTPARFATLLLLPGLWVCRWLTTRAESRRFIRRTPLDGALLLLLFMVLVSLFATYDLSVSLPKIAGVVFGIAAYYAAGEVLVSGPRMRQGLGLYLALGVGLAALVLTGTRWSAKYPALQGLMSELPPLIRGWPGAESGFNPNEGAGALLWFIPLALSLWGAAFWQVVRRRPGAASPGGWALLWATVALLFMTGVFGLTQSRGAALGLAGGLLVMLAALGRRGRWLALAALLVIGWGVWCVGLDRARVLLFGGEAVGPLGEVDLAGRLEIWSRALDAIRDYPVTGLGLNAFRGVVPVLYPLFLEQQPSDIAHAHNQFLQVALDLGLPGLVAYAAVWIGAGVLVVRAWCEARETWLRAAALGLAGSLAAYFVFGLTDTVALGAKPDIAFWLLLALCVGVGRINRAHRTELMAEDEFSPGLANPAVAC